MTLNIAYEYDKVVKHILHEKLTELGLDFHLPNSSEISINSNLDKQQEDKLKKTLSKYAIEIIENPKVALVNTIKSSINQWIAMDAVNGKENISDYLSKQLNYSYSHLSQTFSEVTYTSIESFIILKKIDLAKTLLIENTLTLTEIAYRLDYSGVAHLSRQFKKSTGLTPSSFQAIMAKRHKQSQ